MPLKSTGSGMLGKNMESLPRYLDCIYVNEEYCQNTRFYLINSTHILPVTQLNPFVLTGLPNSDKFLLIVCQILYFSGHWIWKYC